MPITCHRRVAGSSAKSRADFATAAAKFTNSGHVVLRSIADFRHDRSARTRGPCHRAGRIGPDPLAPRDDARATSASRAHAAARRGRRGLPWRSARSRPARRRVAERLGVGAEGLADLGEIHLGRELRTRIRRRRWPRRAETPAASIASPPTSLNCRARWRGSAMILLRDGEDRARIVEIEAAVAGDLHHHAFGRRKLGAERHAGRPAEPGAVGIERRVGLRPRDLQQHRAGVGHRFVENDVVDRRAPWQAPPSDNAD